MPTVTVDKADLFERLGRSYTTTEFDQLCFDFGVELDEDTTEEVLAAVANGAELARPQLKIEIPANRYDLLCIEGIARALRAFLGLEQSPRYKLSSVSPEDMVTVNVAAERLSLRITAVRPYFASAVLRNIKFTQRSYDSFIDLQEKLHQNICRRRQLVSIGTHDLDTVSQPFRYEAKPPADIKFAPLNRDEVYRADELMTLYESDKHLSKYLPIIRDSHLYPIIYDKYDRVLSMPPIINSRHSKITLDTRNVFIDVTATDPTKLAIVVNMVALMFSEYLEEPFVVEPVRVIYADGQVHTTPNFDPTHIQTSAEYINSCTGLSLSPEHITALLTRMSLEATLSPENDNVLLVSIPPTRPDILHECDVMEDAAIAYGFNKLVPTLPSLHTLAEPLQVSKLSDLVRAEWAQAGWVEVLPLILCSHDENFAWLNRADDGRAVKIANPKTMEFQVVRTTLIPGLLKTIRENRNHPLPIKIFESSDIAMKDISIERQARNERHAAAVWCNRTAGFEIVHGLLDRLMKILTVPYIIKAESSEETGYYINESVDPIFLPGRAANVYYRPPPPGHALSKDFSRQPDILIGGLGILHPAVLTRFEISFPCSALEIDLEPFKKTSVTPWSNE